MSQSTPTQHEIDVYAGEFVLGGDKSKSFKKTFPNSKAGPAAMSVSANRFHKIANVLLRIDELRVEFAQNDAAEFDMSVSELKETLNKVMVAGLTEDDSGKYNGLSATTGAVAEFNRMSGNHAATKQEITGKDGGAIETSDMSERELARRIAVALRKGQKKK